MNHEQKVKFTKLKKFLTEKFDCKKFDKFVQDDNSVKFRAYDTMNDKEIDSSAFIGVSMTQITCVLDSSMVEGEKILRKHLLTLYWDNNNWNYDVVNALVSVERI